MENSEPLAWYGAAVILVMAGFVLIPYLRGKSDLEDVPPVVEIG